MRHAVTFALLLAAAGFAAPASADEPLFVNYGLNATPKQGDNDHRQAIYLSVPASTAGKLYLRVFDPDIGGAFDQIDFKHSVTTARYLVFGGSGAFAAQAAQPESLSKEEMTAGKLLASKTYVDGDPKIDGTWQTIAELDPADGDRVGDSIVFRLVVDMTTGLNGNVFDVTMSGKTDDNVAPAGLRIFSYSPTVRMPKRGVLTEIRFPVPAGTKQLTVGNFDAANGSVFLTTKFVSHPLIASGQNKWEATTVALDDGDTEAAVTLSGGREYPNDSTFYVTDGDGKLLPFDLPAHVLALNTRPSAAATSDARGTCTSVKFDGSLSSDAEGDPLHYTWRFGDGESADGVSVVHNYTKDGHFPVTLEVTDGTPQFGNGSAATIEVFVKKPPVPLSIKRTLVAAGEDVPFDGGPSTASLWKVVSHQWSFGDGTALTGDSVVHAFVNPGDYVVSHTVVDDSGHPCNTATEQFTVRVNAPPVSKAGPDQRVAIGEEVTFDGRQSYDPDGKLVDYQWDFGDGSQASGAVVRHTYTKAASYIARLRVRDDSDVANSGDDDTMTVIVNDPPLPDAGADKNAAIGELLTFDGSGSKDRDGSLIAYAWDFGDGEHAAGPLATHSYARSGTYTATLTVTDDSTTSTKSVSDTLKVRINEPPVAEAGPDQLVTASEVQFDGSASHDADDSISIYQWDFADGTSGTGPKPTHVYQKPGTYDVRLTVTDASNTIRNTASDIVRIVVNAVPIADAGPDLVGAPGESLVFDGGRSLDPDGSVAEYVWDFRDGGSASGKTVKHVFAKPGTYAVRLKVKDNTGQPEAVDYAETTVFINNPPVADAGPDAAAAPGEEVHLSAADSYDTDGKIIAYRWDFSDSDQPVDGAEVTRTFKEPGIYTAQLTVTDDSGASNSLATDSVTIVVNHQPVADAGPDIFTASSTILFDGSKSLDADGDALAYAWDFGDGTTATGPVISHTYKNGGSYPVVLTVDDGSKLSNARATAAISVKINRPPVAVAGQNQRVCTGDIVVLDGSKSTDPEGGVLRYSWNFGDGSTSEIVNPTKSYSKGAVYPVTLAVKDDSGLPNGTNSSQIAIQVDQGPVAHAGADILACAKTEVPFDGSASTDIDGVVNSFNWDFGDGNFGGGEKPKHIFDKPGTYRVYLHIQGEKAGICSATSDDEVDVKIIEGPVAVIKAPDAIPVTDEASFDGSGSYMKDGKVTGWHWDFGDGAVADGATATHRYAKAGTYQVGMTLTSDSTSPTCQVVSARHLIRVNAPPVAAAGPDKQVAVNEETVFDASASSDPDGGLVGYDWDFGDGATAHGIQVTHRYAAPGAYTAKLTVHDETGLANSTATDDVAVTVNPPPAPVIVGPEVACTDEQVSWKPEGAPTATAKYLWSFGDGVTADTAEAGHAYENPGWYSLALSVDDGRNLANSKQVATRILHVNRPPRAEAGPDRLVCPGDKVNLDASLSNDPDGAISLYHWDFGDGATLDGKLVDHAYDKPGTYRVKLTVTDDAGSHCSSTTDEMDVVVNAPPVADAGKDREVFIGGANDAVLLDGSASHDPDGTALTATWQIGADASEIGERVRHTFTTAGDYAVTLTVADTTGLACGTASSTVHIIAKQRN